MATQEEELHGEIQAAESGFSADSLQATTDEAVFALLNLMRRMNRRIGMLERAADDRL